jgi:hypothetical protein
LDTLTGHTHAVWGAVQLADGRLLSWSNDQTLRLWSPDGQAQAHLENWKSNKAFLRAWCASQGVDVRVVYEESPYTQVVGNRLCIHEVGKFIGDAEFTRVAVSGQTIAVGDKAGRVIFLRVRGGG